MAIEVKYQIGDEVEFPIHHYIYSDNGYRELEKTTTGRGYIYRIVISQQGKHLGGKVIK